MDFSLRPKAKETQSGTGIELKKLHQNCGALMEQEQICDLMLGPEHNDCQKLFLQNEDCFQRVLCFERCVGLVSPCNLVAHFLTT
jgi:hypothetical protein